MGKMSKITKEMRKKVEKVQEIERLIEKLEEDYHNVREHGVCYPEWHTCGHMAEWFNCEEYNKDLLRIIGHRIKKLKRKRKEMLKED